ncbi:MAG: hypothetical protein WCI72_05835 [archaeon]
MLILHEDLHSEAMHIAKVLEETLQIEPQLQSQDLSFLFKPLRKFKGFWHSCEEISEHFQAGKKEDVVMVLTPKDIYFGDKSKEDDFCFAYVQNDAQKTSIVISTARLKGEDGSPRTKLEVPQESYHKRLAVISLHEIGHDIIRGNHLQEAVWVNAETRYEISTGLHCPNNSCVLYQVGDVKTPDPKNGYIRVGNENRFDTGLDDLISRLKPEFFCADCKKSMRIYRRYK